MPPVIQHPPLRRWLCRGALAVLVSQLLARPAAAHGAPPTAGQGVGLSTAVGAVAVFGLLGGGLAIWAQGSTPAEGVTRLVVRAVGPLLVAIGISAVVSVLASRPSIGLGGGSVGLLAGAVLAFGGDRGTCRDVTVGAIALHRFVEGVTLAALSGAGAVVGLVGAAVLSVHTVAECVAIAGSPARGRRRAIGSVALVTLLFVLGAAVGVAGLAVLAPPVRLGAVALVGGALVALGVDEWRPFSPFPVTSLSTSRE